MAKRTDLSRFIADEMAASDEMRYVPRPILEDVVAETLYALTQIQFNKPTTLDILDYRRCEDCEDWVPEAQIGPWDGEDGPEACDACKAAEGGA